LLLDTKARQSELFAANEKERQAARKEMLSIADQVKSAGKTQEQAIADETTARLAQIEALYKRGAFKDFKE
jgi:nicotinamide mononucleotide adenylyltransferase